MCDARSPGSKFSGATTDPLQGDAGSVVAPSISRPPRRGTSGSRGECVAIPPSCELAVQRPFVQLLVYRRVAEVLRVSEAMEGDVAHALNHLKRWMPTIAPATATATVTVTVPTILSASACRRVPNMSEHRNSELKE